jgi:polysaccharide biosynthesis transport protein
VFVIGAGQPRAGQVVGALKRLHHARGTILGTVLTKFDVKNSAYGYGYGYGENYYGKHDSAALSGAQGQLTGRNDPL